MTSIVNKYKGGDDKAKDFVPQDVVLAKVDVDTFPEVLEIFDLGEPSSLPALLFIQTQAERADLRSTAVDPKEMAQLLQAGLVSMIDGSELYGVGGLDDDLDGDITGTDAEEEAPE